MWRRRCRRATRAVKGACSGFSPFVVEGWVRVLGLVDRGVSHVVGVEVLLR